METDILIANGNAFREARNPQQALACYAQAFGLDFNYVHAFNNYGNVLREMGHPKRAIPFLKAAIDIEPNNVTAQFNLAVAYLLDGDYEKGWPQYEWRWRYEHLAGTRPNFTQPLWTGQDLKDKTILICGEQGLGDNIQFLRFTQTLQSAGAKVIFQVPSALTSLFANDRTITVISLGDPIPNFDYWITAMSLPTPLGLTLKNMPRTLTYINPSPEQVNLWKQRLGIKKKIRIGFCWSGRRDTWINKHKSIPFEYMFNLIKRNPQFEWISLQVDATPEETALLETLKLPTFPGTIQTFDQTAGLVKNLDMVIGVDTAISHLAGAMGLPTWVCLNNYGLDWRWLLNRNDSPWYPTATLFRQPKMDDWQSVMDLIHQRLTLVKI